MQIVVNVEHVDGAFTAGLASEVSITVAANVLNPQSPPLGGMGFEAIPDKGMVAGFLHKLTFTAQSLIQTQTEFELRLKPLRTGLMINRGARLEYIYMEAEKFTISGNLPVVWNMELRGNCKVTFYVNQVPNWATLLP